jgi:hypothetical protein
MKIINWKQVEGKEGNKKSESLVCLKRSERIHRQMANVNALRVITNKKEFHFRRHTRVSGHW